MPNQLSINPDYIKINSLNLKIIIVSSIPNQATKRWPR